MVVLDMLSFMKKTSVFKVVGCNAMHHAFYIKAHQDSR